MMRGTQTFGGGYRSGDSVTIPNTIPLTGYITNGQTRVDFGLPLPKVIESGTSATVTGTGVTIRHSGGGYISQNKALTDIGTVGLAIALNYVRVTITLPSAFTGAANNSVVSVQGTFAVTFS